uniref:No apical meristem-associated C-terminal domain-containing protein n=1 Tax=Lactuca sativa TaxID=4236 RepID=A0A9R1WI43_LACSA|nr:hypothetical protein LSAT_V11C200091910 [Lactuca sativa]
MKKQWKPSNLFPYLKTWLKLKDTPKWKEQTEGTSQNSFLSKRSRNLNTTSQESGGRTHVDINDDLIDLEDEQPLRWHVGRSKAEKRLRRLRDLALSIILERNLVDMSK